MNIRYPIYEGVYRILTVKRLDRICKFGQPDNEKGRGAYFYLE